MGKLVTATGQLWSISNIILVLILTTYLKYLNSKLISNHKQRGKRTLASGLRICRVRYPSRDITNRPLSKKKKKKKKLRLKKKMIVNKIPIKESIRNRVFVVITWRKTGGERLGKKAGQEA